MRIDGIFSSLYLNYIQKSNTDPVDDKRSQKTKVPSSLNVLNVATLLFKPSRSEP